MSNTGLTIEQISIHALREEGDLLWGDTVHRPNQFLSTPSARRATRDGVIRARRKLFLSTPSARRATSIDKVLRTKIEFLSTPSARRATDAHTFGSATKRAFLSTPSARRATTAAATLCHVAA